VAGGPWIALLFLFLPLARRFLIPVFQAQSTTSQPCTLNATATRLVTVVNPQGFHARPAHLFVKLAGSFACQVQIQKGNDVIDGKSILDLLTLGAGNGTTLTLKACGPDADAAVNALAKLIESGFGEMTPAEGQT
jgi:phosphocarrier protein HPr